MNRISPGQRLFKMLDTVERIRVFAVNGEDIMPRDVPVMHRSGDFAVHVTPEWDERTEGFKTDAYTVTHVPTGTALAQGLKNKRDALELAGKAASLGILPDGKVTGPKLLVLRELASGYALRKTFQPKGGGLKKPSNDG